MNEKDAIKDLFSNAFEQHASPVRPEVWQGLQSKMAAAGIASGAGTAAVKGISALTKWIIGGAAVVGTATIATVAVLNSDQTAPAGNQPVKKDTVENAVQPGKDAISDNQHIAQATPQTGSQQTGTHSEQLVEAQPQLIEHLPDNYPVEVANPLAPENTGTKTEDQRTTPNPGTTQPPVNPESNPQGAVSAPPVNGASSSSASSAPVAAITRIPNTFTPNYDGDNDVFFIQSENITDFSVLIFDAQGRQVFRSADPDFRWDGIDLNGNPVPAGQYKCVIIASGSDNKPIKKLEAVVIAR